MSRYIDAVLNNSKLYEEEKHRIAVELHREYEALAKQEGWQTQEQCQVPFEDLPEANRRVMLGVASRVLEIVADWNE